MRARLLAAAIAAVLILSALAAFGCATRDTAERPKPAQQAPATAASTASTAAEATSASSRTPKPDALSTAEAAALEKELSAIERELDGLSIPDDREFDEAAAALY